MTASASQTDAVALLPCPLCAGPGEHWHNPPSSYGAICEACGCEVTSPDNTKDGAIWAWNTRAPLTAPQVPDDLGSRPQDAVVPTEGQGAAVVGLYERIGAVRVGAGDLLDHLLVSVTEDEATAAIEAIACLVRRPLTPNVLELVQYVSWALEEGQPVNDDHIVALLDAIKDTRNPTLSAPSPVSGEGS